MAEKLKVTAAAILLLAGLAGFYYFADSPMIVRFPILLVGIAAGAAVGWTSDLGKRFYVFVQESIAEVKKVVWPTRKESFQTAGAVFAFVAAMAVFLWITDKSLEYLMYDLVLGWKK